MKFYLSPEAKKSGCKFTTPRDGDVGYDLYASEDVLITPGATVLVPTDLYIEIPAGHAGIIKERSSIGALGVAVRGGVIDPGYRGEIAVPLMRIPDTNYLHSIVSALLELPWVHVAKKEEASARFLESMEPHSFVINAGDKIAQLILFKVGTPKVRSAKSIDALSATTRGSDGFGSTGK